MFYLKITLTREYGDKDQPHLYSGLDHLLLLLLLHLHHHQPVVVFFFELNLFFENEIGRKTFKKINFKLQ